MDMVVRFSRGSVGPDDRGRFGFSLPGSSGGQLSVANRNIQLTRRRCKSRGRMAAVTEPAIAPAPPTALEAALDRVGDRWSLLVVDALLEGPHRFGELRDALPGIAPNILTHRLRPLYLHRILVATPYTLPPRRIELSLT